MNYITDKTSKELFNYIIPIICVLSNNKEYNDIKSMYDNILNNDNIKDILEGYIFNYIECNINNNIDIINIDLNLWYNKLNKIDLNNLNNYVLKIKRELYKIIQYPKNLLSFINLHTNFIDNKSKSSNDNVLINFNTLPTSICKIINNFLKYDETGFYSIDNLLDKIPNNKWHCIDNKWFIDTEGNGIFCIAVYLRLMKSLYNFFPNPNIRKKHILEKMIYICNNSDDRYNFWCKYILDPFNEFKLNIFSNNYNISIKFDIVIYNTWISAPSTALWKELKNIIFKISKIRGLIIFTNRGIDTNIFQNITPSINNNQKFEVSKKMSNNYLYISEINYLYSKDFKIENMDYRSYILKKKKFRKIINIDGLGEVRLLSF